MKPSNSKDDQLLWHVGASLRTSRQKHRMSPGEAKAATGISLTEIEPGKKDIKLDTLAALCEHSRTSMVIFFKEIEKQLS